MADFDTLFAAASAARAKAHAPYSNYAVGAALLADDGNIYAGCNVENAAFPEGWCAETTAIGHLVMGGAKRIVRAVVVADRIDTSAVAGGRFCTPCGGCRQRLAEFSGASTRIFLCDETGIKKTLALSDLLPHSFETEVIG